MFSKGHLKQLAPYLFEISPDIFPGMLVPARIFASEKILEEALNDRSLDQLVNVSKLPGVVGQVIAMPDIHEGYGFPIGGVAATEWPHGVISPGGVGYDINCGVRLLVSDISWREVGPKIILIADEFMRSVPSGTGRGGRVELASQELDEVLSEGAGWCLRTGRATKEDLTVIEEGGCLDNADPKAVSDRAKARGRDQLGTIGSGNHFLEIQRVDEVFDKETAKVYGLFKDQIVVAVHCGSRGLGHQVCTDYVRIMLSKLSEYDFVLPDRELACAPADTAEGQSYLNAMAAAANFAWANRQAISHHLRLEWRRIFGGGHELKLLYDVSHNIAKVERHEVDGVAKQLLVHRKGAIRAFGPDRLEVSEKYRAIGQPVLVPGTMGTASFVLRGTDEAMRRTFGTVCHGAGRRMSRHAAKRAVSGGDVRRALEADGIVIRCHSNKGLAEEMPGAYKDVESVVDVLEEAGISKKVVCLKPVAVIKGE